MINVDNLAVSTIRLLSAEAVQKANSGHPGMPMGAAPMAYSIFKNFLKYDPMDTKWDNRDRFILSAGHGSMLLYSLFHLFGNDMTMEDIKNFRQWGSKTPGHPEYGHTKGVEMTTGPLGQGISSAVGFAMAEKILASKFNREGFNVVDHYTYVIAGDGCLMEGISSEASSLAGHLKLGKLIVLYDDNSITIDGATDIAFTEDVSLRYKAYGWQVLSVEDGNDIEAISKAISSAKRVKDKPTLIRVKTVIGYGSPNKGGTSKVHGSPLGEDEIKLVKEGLKYDYDAFTVPEEVKELMEEVKKNKEKSRRSWNNLMNKYKNAHSDLAEEYENWMRGKLLSKVDTDGLYKTDKEKYSTRNASGEILNRLAKDINNLVGGSADLAASNITYIKEGGDFSHSNPQGRNIRFGVREHGMAAIVNGMTLHGGLKAFSSTFLIFSDYLRPSLRLSALMGIDPMYIFTHDSVAVGEDGPTHQPIEQLASIEMIPETLVFRPCDYKETVAGWIKAMEIRNRPMVFALSRQDLPVYKETSKEAEKGGYILVKEEGSEPQVILMGSGSEIVNLVKAREELSKEGIDARVVSIPCKRLFDEQDEKYKEMVLPKSCKARVAMEAGVGYMWSKYLGKKGEFIGIEKFGASAPGSVVMKEYGMTPERVIEVTRKLLK